MWRQQRVSERSIEAGRHGIHRQPLEDLAQQGVAVGVRAARGDADQRVTDHELAARQHLALFDDTDQGAGDVERAGSVDAGHLGGLAAEQRAAGRLARFGHPGDDFCDLRRIELAGGHVVEEEQRPSTLHQHVVDAVVDDVGTDAAVPAEACRKLDLGADAVGGGDQHRLVHRLDGLAAEGAAEAPDAGAARRGHAFARRRASSG